jgi:hypothetical protein
MSKLFILLSKWINCVGKNRIAADHQGASSIVLAKIKNGFTVKRIC